MALELERKANAAFIDDDFVLAVDLFSKALEISPNKAELLASRAQANIKLHNYLDAVCDTNKATQLDPSMARAYLRKGIACFKLEEYQTAKVALEKGVPFAQNDPRFAKLIKECNNCIAVENISETVGHGASTPSAKPKYRHEYYQKPEEVVVTIFAKGIPEKNVVVDFSVQTLSVAIEVPGETPYYLHLRLFGKIIPDTSRYAVMSTKVEIRLAKAEALNWTSLEISDKGQRPAYPSSKAKVIDWDKVQARIEEEEKEQELKDNVNIVKDIHQKADANTHRAMNKIFVESIGTVLSTDWSEVASKVVESKPPDDSVIKKLDP